MWVYNSTYYITKFIKRQSKLPFFCWLSWEYFYTSLVDVYLFFVYKNIMKKIILSLSILCGLFFLSLTNADDLANLWLSFCGTWAADAMNIALEPGTETGICYTLSNGWKNDVMVKVGFVDGTFTNDQRKNKACFTDEVTQTFWQYITGYQQIVSLKAGQSITQNALLQYPLGMHGLFHGCLVYSVLTPTTNSTAGWTSFSIQMRRAKFIDVISGNPEELMKWNTIILEEFLPSDWDNLSANPRVRIYKDLDGSYVVALKVKNIGVFDENLALTGLVSNFLTHKEVFTLSRVLTPSQSLLVTQKLLGKPNYNLSVALNISHLPTVFGGMEARGWSFQEFASFGIWDIVTWLTLSWLLVVVWIIYLLVMDLKRRSSKANVTKKKK